MEEKIIEAKFGKSTLAWILLGIGIGLIIFSLILGINEYNTRTFYESYNSVFGGYKSWTETAEERYGSLGNYLFEELIDYICSIFDCGPSFDHWYAPLCCLGVIVILVSLFFFWQMSRGKLTVTNQRVTGKASFGKAVDLPITQISAVALGACCSITVATSAGRLHFWSIQNRNEVHSALTDIISKMQVADVKQQTPPTTVPSAADELKKFKELLDAGIITQEEFDAKKKQLLGL
jgi:hypothetical protein